MRRILSLNKSRELTEVTCSLYVTTKMHSICKKVLILLALVGDKSFLYGDLIIENPPRVINMSRARHKHTNGNGMAFKYLRVENIATINILSAIG